MAKDMMLPKREGPSLGFCRYGLLQIGHEWNIVGAARP